MELQPIRAKVLDDIGKHYSTEVIVQIPGERDFFIEVYIPVGRPSDRDLASQGVDIDGWRSNVEVNADWDTKAPIREVYPDSSHYQSQIEYIVARTIAQALDGMYIQENWR